MTTRKKMLREKHPDTLTAMANMASIYWSQGCWDKAEKLQREELEISRRVLG